MESLALVASIVVLSSLLVGLAALASAAMRFRTPTIVLGILSLCAGVWWLAAMPHAPLFGAFNVTAGALALFVSTK